MISQELWNCMVKTAAGDRVVTLLVDTRAAFIDEVKRRFPNAELRLIYQIKDRAAINKAINEQRKARERLGT